MKKQTIELIDVTTSDGPVFWCLYNLMLDPPEICEAYQKFCLRRNGHQDMSLLSSDDKSLLEEFYKCHGLDPDQEYLLHVECGSD